MDAESTKGSEAYPGINVLVRMLVLALLLGSLFVIPTSYKPFWISIVGLVILSYIGFSLYFEWDKKAFSADGTKEEKEKYKSWAIMILYIMNITVTVVISAILIVFIWKLYGLVSKRTNLVAGKQDTEEEDMEIHTPGAQAEGHAYNNIQGSGRQDGERYRRRKKHRRPPFV